MHNPLGYEVNFKEVLRRLNVLGDVRLISEYDGLIHMRALYRSGLYDLTEFIERHNQRTAMLMRWGRMSLKTIKKSSSAELNQLLSSLLEIIKAENGKGTAQLSGNNENNR